MIKGRRVLILGLGLSGQSAARFLLKRGVASLVGVDANQVLLNRDRSVASLVEQGMRAQHESEPLTISDFDLVVTSPGIPPSHPYYRQAIEKGIEVIGEMELACRNIQNCCLAVTGTNGKTTVTLLTEHVLNCSGKKAKALGNVGIPLTTALDEQEHSTKDIFVIELSSFQLETLKSVFIDAGVLLNITPDHLDRYESMQEYALAKIGMRRNVKPEGKLFIEDRCAKEFQKHFEKNAHFSYGYENNCFLYTDTYHLFQNQQAISPLPPVLQGKRSHDIENIMASYALCASVGISAEQFFSALSTFKKPSHRIEFVRQWKGLRFYDDSKGTNIDAVIRAVDSFQGKIVLIAGGVDKGAPYTSWIEAFRGKVTAICAIGQAAEKIKADLDPQIPVKQCPGLDKAVEEAVRLVHPDGIILLSPGCSSYDMFRDYAHRGREFQRIVNAL